MKRSTRAPFLAVLATVGALAVTLAGCTSGGTSAPQSSSAPAASSSDHALAADISAELKGIIPPAVQKILQNTGTVPNGQAVPGYPNGVPATPAGSFKFTQQEIDTLKKGSYTAAIAMHLSDAAWPELQIKGIKKELGRFGIKVVATTSANGNAATQVSQLATLVARKPTAIFSIAVDPNSEVAAYKSISTAGIKLIMLDNVPKGMAPGKDYIGNVSANNAGNGRFAAEQLHKAIGCAPLGFVGLNYVFPVVNARIDAAKKYFKSVCPNQKIYEKDLSDLNVAPAAAFTTALLAQHTDITGLFAGWDSIAEQMISAEKTAGKKLPLATTDIGPTSALDMAQGYILAAGGQQPYAQGVAEADDLAYSLLGKPVPPYVGLPTVPVTLRTLIPAYKIINGSNPPANVIDAIKARVGIS